MALGIALRKDLGKIWGLCLALISTSPKANPWHLASVAGKEGPANADINPNPKIAAKDARRNVNNFSYRVTRSLGCGHFKKTIEENGRALWRNGAESLKLNTTKNIFWDYLSDICGSTRSACYRYTMQDLTDLLQIYQHRNIELKSTQAAIAQKIEAIEKAVVAANKKRSWSKIKCRITEKQALHGLEEDEEELPVETEKDPADKDFALGLSEAHLQQTIDKILSVAGCLEFGTVAQQAISALQPLSGNQVDEVRMQNYAWGRVAEVCRSSSVVMCGPKVYSSIIKIMKARIDNHPDQSLESERLKELAGVFDEVGISCRSVTAQRNGAASMLPRIYAPTQPMTASSAPHASHTTNSSLPVPVKKWVVPEPVNGVIPLVARDSDEIPPPPTIQELKSGGHAADNSNEGPATRPRLPPVQTAASMSLGTKVSTEFFESPASKDRLDFANLNIDCPQNIPKVCFGRTLILDPGHTDANARNDNGKKYGHTPYISEGQQNMVTALLFRELVLKCVPYDRTARTGVHADAIRLTRWPGENTYYGEYEDPVEANKHKVPLREKASSGLARHITRLMGRAATVFHSVPENTGYQSTLISFHANAGEAGKIPVERPEVYYLGDQGSWHLAKSIMDKLLPLHSAETQEMVRKGDYIHDKGLNIFRSGDQETHRVLLEPYFMDARGSLAVQANSEIAKGDYDFLQVYHTQHREGRVLSGVKRGPANVHPKTGVKDIGYFVPPTYKKIATAMFEGFAETYQCGEGQR